MFHAHDLCCIRSDRILFENISLTVRAGEIWQIAGKNGAGKSSLLRILAGFADPDEGAMTFLGHPWPQRHPTPAELCYIGHLAGIQPQLTAIEHLEFWQVVLQYPQQSTDALLALLARLGLAGLEDIPCSQLSAGQQRRVSLARLWCTRAKLWILDEPFTALDVHTVEVLQRHFQQHITSGGAVIVTTHQPLSLPAESVQRLELSYRW